jgi:hypothetical protein
MLSIAWLYSSHSHPTKRVVQVEENLDVANRVLVEQLLLSPVNCGLLNPLAEYVNIAFVQYLTDSEPLTKIGVDVDRPTTS